MGQKRLSALLVSDGIEPFASLKVLLKSLEMEIWSAQNCEEARQLLAQTHSELIFTATRLPAGTWMDVVALAKNASQPTNVIVVGECKDTSLYLTTMDSGAFDFILPPFEAEAVAHVARVAAENVRRQRKQQAMIALRGG